MKRTQEDLAVLNSFWFWRDGLITHETMLKVLGNLKERHPKIQEEYEKEELEKIEEMKGGKNDRKNN